MKDDCSYVYGDISLSGGLPLGDSNLEIGDLVTTLMGEHGVVIGYGEEGHSILAGKYYKILMKDGHVYNYISGALKKYEIKLTNKAL